MTATRTTRSPTASTGSPPWCPASSRTASASTSSSSTPRSHSCSIRGPVDVRLGHRGDRGDRDRPPARSAALDAFGHVESDECGSMNQFLAAAPRAQVAHGALGCQVSPTRWLTAPSRSCTARRSPATPVVSCERSPMTTTGVSLRPAPEPAVPTVPAGSLAGGLAGAAGRLGGCSHRQCVAGEPPAVDTAPALTLLVECSLLVRLPTSLSVRCSGLSVETAHLLVGGCSPP